MHIISNDYGAHFLRKIGSEYNRGRAKSQIIIVHTFSRFPRFSPISFFLPRFSPTLPRLFPRLFHEKIGENWGKSGKIGEERNDSADPDWLNACFPLEMDLSRPGRPSRAEHGRKGLNACSPLEMGLSRPRPELIK